MEFVRPRRPRSRLPWAAITGVALTAGLALLHGRLLWQRVADGSLLEPTVAARWIASALVAWVMLRLWSRGLSLLSGRRAAVLWLAVLVIHLGAPGGSLPAVAPAVPALLALPAALALVALLGLRPRPLDGPPPRPDAGDGNGRRTLRPADGWPAALYSRPPPAALPV